jgi:uncharacterized membrane protein
VFAQNLAMRLIGLVTTVLILGAVYLFIVKPVLDTTNNAFDSVNDTVNTAFQDVGVDGVNVNDVTNGDFTDIQKQLKQSGLSSKEQRRAERLLHCVQRVQPDTAKMSACAQRFQ